MAATGVVHGAGGARAVAVVVAAIAILGAGCARNDGRQLQSPAPGATAPTSTTAVKAIPGSPTGAFALTSPAVANGGELPTAHTCTGPGDPLPLVWTDPTSGVAEFALVAKDLDESGTIHWVVGAIPPDARALTPGSLPDQVIDFGYQAPCPQPGETAHIYSFTLYGLTAPLGLADSMSPAEAAAAIEGQPAEAAQLTTFYAR